MKTLKLIALAALALFFSQCKTTAPTAPSGPAPSVLEVMQILDTTQSKFFEFAAATNGDPWKAIELTTSWVATQPNVKSAAAFDSTYIVILTKSGLNTTFFFNELDSAGKSIYRGGSKSSAHAKSRLSLTPLSSKNTISNKKVLIYAPVDDFSTQEEIQHNIDLLTAGGLEVTLLKNEQCTYNIVEQFKDYGLVIIDTHGNGHGFQTGTKLQLDKVKYENEEAFKQVVVAKYGSDYYTKLVDGDIGLITSVAVYPLEPFWEVKRPSKTDADLGVSSQYINKLPPLFNTIVFGNMCYSASTVPISQGVPDSRFFGGDTPPIGTAFINRNPISYYGYAYDDGTSAKVSNDFAKQMEDSIIKELVVDYDSTGSAHLNASDAEFGYRKFNYLPYFLHLKHFGADDYSYQKCGDPIIDERDGQKYATVCIGKQIWMAENLRYNAPGSACYDDDPNNCVTYGRLYDWNTVMNGAASSSSNPSLVQGICPKGWHVPSVSEWTQLIDQLGGQSAAGYPLKATTLWTTSDGSTNSSGFSALPGGRRDLYQGAKEYIGIGEQASFWTSTEYSQLPTGAYDTFLSTGSSVNVSGGVRETDYNSCRCVKDK